MPADYRAAVLLADVEEFSYKEIAGMLDVPIGTVMSRLSRGRKLLRGQLSDWRGLMESAPPVMMPAGRAAHEYRPR